MIESSELRSHEGDRRLVMSRRTVMKGSVAAGIVVSAPLIPSSAWAREREPEVVDQPLQVTGSAVTTPHADHGAAGGVASARLTRRIEVDAVRMLGVSWVGGPESGASVRWSTDGVWSPFAPLHVDPSEAPDPGEGDADTSRRISAPLWVDRADEVEVAVPDGARDPVVHLVGESERTVLSIRSSAVEAAAPSILPRSAWSARPFNGQPQVASSLRLAIVHHSASGNGYPADQVPAILRSIQAYHQNTNGWNDVAYNFFVDRFGRIWEGRAGGTNRAVVGGHTFGCNTGTVGVCYLGNLVGAALPAAAEQAITRLLSWKFNQVHAVSPVGTTTFAPLSANAASKYPANVSASHPTVVGHSHFSATQCPGQAAGRVSTIRSQLTRIDQVLGIQASPTGGYWLVDSRGQAHPRRGAPFRGSRAGLPLNAPMITMAPTAGGGGYWMLARDGGIFSFGDAAFYGSTGGRHLNRPVVGMSTTRSGRGYWLVASDGGIFSFGDAAFYGSTGGRHLNRPVVGMARTPSGRGYWLFAQDGGIFTFGDARFFGSGGGSALPAAAVGVAVHPNGSGYWLALADGSVLAFNVANRGRVWATASDPVVGIAATPDGGGYWLARRSGNVSGFGNAG